MIMSVCILKNSCNRLDKSTAAFLSQNKLQPTFTRVMGLNKNAEGPETFVEFNIMCKTVEASAAYRHV